MAAMSPVKRERTYLSANEQRMFKDGHLNQNHLNNPGDHVGTFNALQSPKKLRKNHDFLLLESPSQIISCWDHPDNIGSGQGDLYITFKREDGTWTEELNMGKEINTQYGENCPQVSPDGKYFFFNRYNPDANKGNIYWVDVKVIKALKPDEIW